MPRLKFCLITPSYKPDFVRCRLLAQSIDRFVAPSIHHYIIVDRQDWQLFQQLKSDRRTILTVESILPWWIQKIPIIKNGWFSFKTLPIRNWLIQQIVKLEIVNHIREDILVFVDSDVFLIAPFDTRQFVREDRVRLQRVSFEPSSVSDLKTRIDWCNSATSVLGLPQFKKFDRENPFVGYVGNLITWRRDNVLLLHQQIERVTQTSWIEAIANCWSFSEYMLYGIFVEQILGYRSGHYEDSRSLVREYWGTTPLSKAQLQKIWQKTTSECLAIMISAKSETPVETYAPAIGFSSSFE